MNIKSAEEILDIYAVSAILSRRGRWWRSNEDENAYIALHRGLVSMLTRFVPEDDIVVQKLLDNIRQSG